MAYETEEVAVGNEKHIYSWSAEDEINTRKLVFRIDATSQIVEFIPRDDFPLDRFAFEGFRAVPAELNEAGYIKTGGVQYHLARVMQELGVRELRVSKTATKSLRKIGGKLRMVMPYDMFQRLIEGFKSAAAEERIDRQATVDAVFHDLAPTKWKIKGVSSARTLSRLEAGLDLAVIDKLPVQLIERFLDFTKALLEKRYTNAAKRRELFGAAKLKIDQVALSEIISEFEKHLKKSPSESVWGDFLRKNLFLVESRYVHVIERLNVVLASSREVDFGLVDSEGFVDLFEIKKPETTLLSSTQDRGNHYWHTEAVKAIVQAEKYLYNATQRAATLQQDIGRQKGIAVNVIRPRAVVIMGSLEQLDTPEKKEDFRVLRMSLRNVEIMLYDELLQSLRNQLGKVYIA